MKKKLIIIIILILAISSISIGVVLSTKEQEPKKKQPDYPIKTEEKKDTTSIFTLNFLKAVNSNVEENKNYLVSPYSVEIALQMLKDGAAEKTYDEIDEVIGSRKIENLNIKDRISTSNAVFIKEKYKYLVNNSYQQLLKDEYDAEVLYDEFTSPKVINDWAYKKTNGMIEKLLSDISKDFVLGLANATAIDVKWKIPFECFNTMPEEFTTSTNEIKKVQMMNNSYEGGISYFENNASKGVIIPYKKYDLKTGEEVYDEDSKYNQLEFVGILPEKTPQEFLNNLTEEEFKNLTNNKKDASSKLHINVSLPKFDYDYDFKNFKIALNNLGIKKAFKEFEANFNNIIKQEEKQIYVEDAIHKTKITLNEEGTKAAAVTFFGMSDATAVGDIEKPEIINVEFNKPFIYIIRDVKTKEMIFYGVVYEPLEWTKDTKSCDEINE